MDLTFYQHHETIATDSMKELNDYSEHKVLLGKEGFPAWEKFLFNFGKASSMIYGFLLGHWLFV